MGFFSDLLKGVGAVVGAVINPGATIGKLLRGTGEASGIVAKTPLTAAQATTGVIQTVTGPGTAGPLAIAGRGVGTLAQPIGSGLVGGAVAGRGVILTGGNGKVAKRTIIQTINLDTGIIVMEIVKEGAPFLMNKAVRELQRTTKKLRKANAKIPTREKKQSLGAKLTERVLNQTIQDVGDHHGHHGN